MGCEESLSPCAHTRERRLSNMSWHVSSSTTCCIGLDRICRVLLCAHPPGLREGEARLLQDRIFDNEINIAIERTKEAYQGMMFREALKMAAYDLGNARDVYR